jgi:hypothetical protein
MHYQPLSKEVSQRFIIMSSKALSNKLRKKFHLVGVRMKDLRFRGTLRLVKTALLNQAMMKKRQKKKKRLLLNKLAKRRLHLKQVLLVLLPQKELRHQLKGVLQLLPMSGEGLLYIIEAVLLQEEGEELWLNDLCN